ncbi:hypothetical protein ACULLL_11225 [Lysinibacillus irui]|uniref:hypothetical protein n=1 Tax=Lysinibacillus irui TaxID=2998077 RepID=UPI00404411D8
MKPYLRIVSFCLLIMILVPANAVATSWVYPFVVWNGYMYEVTDEKVTTIENEIGAVTKYSDMKQYGGNFSNAYPKGTKYFAIKGMDTEVAIAVEVDNGNYLKAIRDGEYTYPSQLNVANNLFKALVVTGLLLILFLLFNALRKK